MGETPVTIQPGDQTAAGEAGRGHLRASHADREQAIGTLKAAFVAGMLAKNEFDLRVGQAFASRTCAELATLTADLPAGLAAAGPARPPVRVRRPLARAAAGAGGCLTIAAAAVWGAGILDPGPFARSTSGPPGFLSPSLMFVIAFYAVLAAFGFLIVGVGNSSKQRRSRGQLPPRPRPGGHALDGEQGGSTGHGRVPPGTGDDQARADLRAPKSPRGIRPARGAPGIPAPIPKAT